jgi:hypothetical protein
MLPVRRQAVRVFAGKESTMNEQEQRITITEAARRLQTTPLNVLMHIKRGLLKGVEENGVWLVDCVSLGGLQARTGGGKAHDVCASACSKKHACGGGCS